MSLLRFFFLPAALALLLFSCSKPKAVRLEVNFSSRTAWNYTLDIRVSGKAEQWDTLRNFSSTASGTLTGVPGSDGTILRFSIMDPRIESDVLPEAEVENLRQQIAGTAMVLSLKDGTISAADTAAIPSIYLSGWDIYRTLARVLPSVPHQPIVPGYTWERERKVPLSTVMGNTAAHLYQSFVLDSCTTRSDGSPLAHMSWRFTYKVEKPAGDSLGTAKAIPLSGSGTGNALFDVKAKALLGAHVTFTVPRQGTGLEWTEEVTMQLND